MTSVITAADGRVSPKRDQRENSCHGNHQHRKSGRLRWQSILKTDQERDVAFDIDAHVWLLITGSKDQPEGASHNMTQKGSTYIWSVRACLVTRHGLVLNCCNIPGKSFLTECFAASFWTSRASPLSFALALSSQKKWKTPKPVQSKTCLP